MKCYLDGNNEQTWYLDGTCLTRITDGKESITENLSNENKSSCTLKYRPICPAEYDPSTNTLVIGIREVVTLRDVKNCDLRNFGITLRLEKKLQ
jgi:hypothetical protein